MAMEYVKSMQVASVTPGVLQSNGTQPATILLTALDGSGFSVSIMVNMADPLSQYAVGAQLWMRIDDTLPSMTIPSLGVQVSENTATVVVATVENPDAPLAQ